MDKETLQVRVACKRIEAEDIVSFNLARLDDGPLPAFEAGAHIDVHVPGGLVRQYSLCNKPEEVHRYQIAVLLDPASRGGSIALHRAVWPGDVIRISEPRNHFALAATTGRPLLLAAGIGVTPILCMAEQLAHSGADFEMHYFTRREAKTAFLRRIRESGFAAKVALHFDDGPTERRMSLPLVLANPAARRHAYFCGPAVFLQAAMEAAKQNGWPADHVHFESFKPSAPVSQTLQTFEVQIATTGACYVVPPDKTVAQVLAENSLDIPLSCEQGICGTCLTRVLAGVPDHRDCILTPDERAKNDQFTPCCSRSLSPRLVLDL